MRQIWSSIPSYFPASDSRSLLSISGAVGGRDYVRVANEGATAPKLSPAVAMQINRHHPRVLALVSYVTSNDPRLRYLVLPAF